MCTAETNMASKILEDMAAGGSGDLGGPLLRQCFIYFDLTRNDRPKGASIEEYLDFQSVDALRTSLQNVAKDHLGCDLGGEIDISKIIYYPNKKPPCIIAKSTDCYQAALQKPLKIGVRYSKYFYPLLFTYY